MNVELCETASVMKEKAEKRKKRACAVRVMHVTLDTLEAERTKVCPLKLL